MAGDVFLAGLRGVGQLDHVDRDRHDAAAARLLDGGVGRDRVRAFRVELFATRSFQEARDVFDRYWESVNPGAA